MCLAQGPQCSDAGEAPTRGLESSTLPLSHGSLRKGFNFRETSHMRSFVNMRSFVKIKSSQNGEITLSITDIGKSCTSREFLSLQECLLMRFAKIKFWRENFRVYSIKINFLCSIVTWLKSRISRHFVRAMIK